MSQNRSGKLLRFFAVPTFSDKNQTHLARQLHAHLLSMILGYTGVILLIMFIAPGNEHFWLGMIIAPLAVNLFLLTLVKLGHLRLGALFFVVELWLLISINAFMPVGLGARAAWGFFIVVFTAGMLLGRWAGIMAAGVCSLTTLAIAFLPRVPSPRPWLFWLINTLYLLVMILLQDMAGRSIREALADTRSELRERLLAQAALFESEKKHREMVNHLPFSIFEADLRGNLTFTNQTSLEWFGYNETEFLSGLNILDIVAEIDRPRARESFGRIISGKEVSFHEYLVKRKDGSAFTALIRTRPIFKQGVAVGLQGSLIDINDRRQAEKDRELIISLLRATVESTTDGILVIDLFGKIVHFNQRFAQMWRIPDEILAAGEDAQALAFVSTQLLDPQGFSGRVKEMYADTQAESYDLLEFKDGRYFERYSRPQMLGDRPVGRVWSFRDISERKQSEKALLVKNQFISSLLRALPVAVFFKDRDGKYTGCNDEFTDIMGFSSDEIKGKTVHEIWPGELAETYHRKDLELIKEQKHQVYEYQVQDKQGQLRPVIFAKDVFLDANGEVEGLVGAFLDITERKRAEEALLESEYRYRTLFEAASDAIFLIKGTLFFDCNSRTLEIFGCTRQQIIGSSPDRFSPPLQPDGSTSREKSIEKINAAYAGQPQFFEWVHCRTDQTPFTAEVSLNRIELREAVFLLAIVRDITDRRLLEGQLLQAQKMEAIGILAGGVAHDFNNILSTIVGYASLLQMKFRGDEQLKEYIERILASTERAVSLTHSLLAFSRKQEIELQPVEINGAIFGFHKILARLIGEDIDFSLNLADQDLVVEVDVRQLEQVLMNLATNSRDAMPNGGKLAISTSIMILAESAGEIPAGSYALVSIADTGFGMDAKTQAHLFEPFFTTKEVGKGTGLGLAIVYGIIKKHSGFIRVSSAVDQGTTLNIYLPLKSIRREKRSRRRSEKLIAGTETILLIEDDVTVRQVIRSILEEFGYAVIEAVDGVDAVAAFARERDNVQLILCDLIMPKKNGRETIAEIRQIKADVKVIFLSGYSADIISRKGIMDPGIPMLLKPIKPTELLTKVRQLLDS